MLAVNATHAPFTALALPGAAGLAEGPAEAATLAALGLAFGEAAALPVPAGLLDAAGWPQPANQTAAEARVVPRNERREMCMRHPTENQRLDGTSKRPLSSPKTGIPAHKERTMR